MTKQNINSNSLEFRIGTFKEDIFSREGDAYEYDVIAIVTSGTFYNLTISDDEEKNIALPSTLEIDKVFVLNHWKVKCSSCALYIDDCGIVLT